MGIIIERGQKGGLPEPDSINATVNPAPTVLNILSPNPNVSTTQNLVVAVQPTVLALLSPNGTFLSTEDVIYQASPTQLQLITPPATHASDTTIQVGTTVLTLSSPAATAIVNDPDVPTPTLSANNNPTNTNPTITVDFGEVVTGFEPADVEDLNDNFDVTSFTNVDGAIYTFVCSNITDSEATLSIRIPAASVIDGNSNPNNQSDTLDVVYDTVGDKPVITTTADLYTQLNSIPFTVTFPELPIGFVSGDLVLGNGTVSNFIDQGGGVFTFNFNPTADGAYTIDIPAGRCTDQASNNNIAADQFIGFHDEVAPTVSDDSLSFSDITFSGATVNWLKSTDAVSQQDQIRYKVYESTSNNITNVADAEANGTLIENSLNINNTTVSLSSAQTKYLQVVSEDQAGNKLAYTSASVKALDNTAPTLPGNSQVTINNETTYSFEATWDKATDNDTAQGSLEYALFTSLTNNLNNASTIVSNGTIHGGWQTDPASIIATGLDENQLYYTNIAVRDSSGNITVYSQRTITTNPAADPYSTSTILETITPIV